MAQATRAVRSFRDEYLLELVNLDNVDAIHDQDVDERVLSKSLVANIENHTHLRLFSAVRSTRLFRATKNPARP